MVIYKTTNIITGRIRVHNLELNKTKAIHKAELNEYLINSWKPGQIKKIINK